MRKLQLDGGKRDLAAKAHNKLKPESHEAVERNLTSPRASALLASVRIIRAADGRRQREGNQQRW